LIHQRTTFTNNRKNMSETKIIKDKRFINKIFIDKFYRQKGKFVYNY